MVKHLIFRWSYKHPITGKIVRAKRRPFPMLVNDETGELSFAPVEKKQRPEGTL